MRNLMALGLLLAMTTDALPLAYDCPTVQQYVRQYGRVAAYVWARQQGYSTADIARVRKACFSK